MMRRIWLTFAQAVTVSLAVLFVINTFKPEWLSRPNQGQSVVLTPRPEGAPVGRASALPSYNGAASKAVPSVVHIFTGKEVRQSRHPLMDDPLFRRFFGDTPNLPSQRQSGLGSGVIVSPDGYILTNNHVIEAADDIEVSLNDGRRFKAKGVGGDPETDLAVLRIEGESLPVVNFGKSESLKVGDVVLAIGNPFGVGQTVTMGIVSALGRTQLGINTYENFIQTDAAINPGNSGGALVDASGTLVGINTAIFSQSGGSLGIGFAIPVSLAQNVMEQIIQSGQVTRGWIGVGPQEITPELAESFKLQGTHGVIIASVLRGGPADKAGIKPGDVMLSIDGEDITDVQSMLNIIAGLPPGRLVPVKLRRDKQDLDIQVAIGKRPPAKARSN